MEEAATGIGSFNYAINESTYRYIFDFPANRRRLSQSGIGIDLGQPVGIFR